MIGRLFREQFLDSFAVFAPAQLEVVCNEYFRQSEEFDGYAPTLPVGRTLRDMDTVRQTNAGFLSSQVTKKTISLSFKRK